jgi:hypothetical protein
VQDFVLHHSEFSYCCGANCPGIIRTRTLPVDGRHDNGKTSACCLFFSDDTKATDFSVSCDGERHFPTSCEDYQLPTITGGDSGGGVIRTYTKSALKNVPRVV